MHKFPRGDHRPPLQNGLCLPLSPACRTGRRRFDGAPAQAWRPILCAWKKETDAIHAALAERTRVMAARLNSLPGVSCVDSPGALYLYPRIRLSKNARNKAAEAGKEPDAFYALALLDETGICVVPGSGFGQKEGEWHYRLTCLCPGVDEYVGKLEKFHLKWVEMYGEE